MSSSTVEGNPPRALPADFDAPCEKNLGRRTRSILRHMAMVILPKNERIRVEPYDAIVNYVDNYVPYLPPLLRLGFPVGVWLFELGAVVLTGRPFTWLSQDAKERYIAGWARSPLWWRRDLLKGVKGLMMMGFFELPEVHDLINYDQAGHVEFVKARRAATYGHDA